MKKLVWYFDFISPFAYLQHFHLASWAAQTQIELRPILFAGLLNHWQHKGPAEIPAKRVFTYRHVLWLARQQGRPIKAPEAHPFNPLLPLRLAVALHAQPKQQMTVVHEIFDFIWGQGQLPVDGRHWDALMSRLGLAHWQQLVTATQVKEQLKRNTTQAAKDGLFGVPTAVVDRQLFWGVDASAMLLDYLADDQLFNDEEMVRISNLPAAAQRQ